MTNTNRLPQRPTKEDYERFVGESLARAEAWQRRRQQLRADPTTATPGEVRMLLDDYDRIAAGLPVTYSPMSGYSPGEVKVWDAETGKPLFTVSETAKGFNSVVFSPDGKRLACGDTRR
jgi:WD40 repeat protein